MSARQVRVKSALGSEEGQDLAEYVILVSLIAVVLIAAVTVLGQGFSTAFQDIVAGL